jgi:Mn-containing catalase
MTQPDPRQGAVAVAEKLTEALNGVRGELQTVNAASEERDAELQRYGHRNRIIGVGAVAFTIIDVIATVVAIVAVVVAIHASNRAAVAQAQASVAQSIAKAEHVSLLASCATGNAYRAEQVAVWGKLASLTKEPSGTSEAKAARDKKAVDGFLAFVGQLNKPRDCATVYKIPPTSGKHH